MALGRRDGGFMDANCSSRDRTKGQPLCQPETGRPNCCTSPASPATTSSSFNNGSTLVSRAPSPPDAAKMGAQTHRCDQQEQDPPQPEQQSADTGRWCASRLTQELQQLEFLKSRVHSRNSSTPLCSLAPAPAPRVHPTQNQPTTMVDSLRSFRGVPQHRAPTTLQAPLDLSAVAMMQNAPYWPPGTLYSQPIMSTSLMWESGKSISRPSVSRPPPFDDGRDNTVYGPTPLAEIKTEAMDDDDVLLDDASLDMLVTTLAREAAQDEARRRLHPEAESDTMEFDDDDDDEGHHHDEDSALSSAESSNPSTPSTGSSNASSGKAKGKTKPKRVRRSCIVPNCGKRSRSLGLCIAHGGGRRCIVDGCDKSSQGGNLCIKHGGGKRCRVDGCEKAAQTNSLCKAHGGGPRCQFANCQKSSQGGGFCRQHGGGKRCAFPGCKKGTQRGSYCALHGGSRLCVIEGCERNDRGGGYCAHHGGGKRCTIALCSRPSRRNGLCSTHLRVLGHQQSMEEHHDASPHDTKAGIPSPSPTPSPPPQ